MHLTEYGANCYLCDSGSVFNIFFVYINLLHSIKVGDHNYLLPITDTDILYWQEIHEFVTRNLSLVSYFSWSIMGIHFTNNIHDLKFTDRYLYFNDEYKKKCT